MIGSLIGKLGLGKFQLIGAGVLIVALGTAVAFGKWQYTRANTEQANAVLAESALEDANLTNQALRQQRANDIFKLESLESRLSDTRDALVRAQNDLDSFRGQENEDYVKENPDIADRTINDRTGRLFAEIACETGSRADCADTSANPGTTN